MGETLRLKLQLTEELDRFAWAQSSPQRQVHQQQGKLTVTKRNAHTDHFVMCSCVHQLAFQISIDEPLIFYLVCIFIDQLLVLLLMFVGCTHFAFVP